MALNGLYVPTKAPWFAAFQQELLSFPAGKHDDQVDALGLIGQLLDKFMAGRRPPKEKGKRYPQDDGYKVIETEHDLRRWLRDTDESDDHVHNWVREEERAGLDWKAM